MRTRDELAAIGRDLVLARQLGVPWKALERKYGNGRTWLWTLYCDALEEMGRAAPTDEERCSVNISAIASAPASRQACVTLEGSLTAQERDP